jgi:hypothetical protein
MKIYKYRPISSILVEELEQSYLSLASPFVLNDIYDCQVPVDVTSTVTSFLDSISTVVDEAFSGDEEFGDLVKKNIIPDVDKQKMIYFNKVVYDLVNRQRVTCFTDSFENLPMWAHYASNHGGVCLEFTVEKDTDTAWQYLAEVNYVEEIPTLIPPRSFEDLSESERFMNSLFLTKHEKWKYESEQRLIIDKQFLQETTNPMYSKMYYKREYLTGVFFGYRVSETSEDFKRILNALISRANPPALRFRRKVENAFGSYWEDFSY